MGFNFNLDFIYEVQNFIYLCVWQVEVISLERYKVKITVEKKRSIKVFLFLFFTVLGTGNIKVIIGLVLRMIRNT